MRNFEGTKILRWQSWDGTGLEHCEIRSDELDFIAEGTVIAPEAERFAARYVIRFEASWKVQAVSVAIAGTDRVLALTTDDDGLWYRDGEPLPQLRYAIAPDLSISPITNTFAIRRLHLHEGQGVDIETAYFDCPDLRFFADPQRYTCLEQGRRYRYESRDSAFTRDITVDEDGFVVEYPGLFRRVP